MKVFKTKYFGKWAKKSQLSDSTLAKAGEEVINGLIDADLGSNLIKKRVPIGSKGKRAGVRIILAYKREDSIFFLYGFEKNQKDNISSNELKLLKIIASSLLKLNSKQIEIALKTKELIELSYKDKGN